MGGQAAHSPHKNGSKSAAEGGARSCSPAPPTGCPGLSESNQAALGGACGKTQHRCTVRPAPPALRGKGK